MNLIFILIMGLIIGAVFLEDIPRGQIYRILSIILIGSVINQWWGKNSPIPTLLELKEINAWEREKLGENWFKYHFPNMLLRFILGAYFCMQCFVYKEKIPFRYELPLWYWIVIPVLIICMANVNMTFHTRRIDTKTKDELKTYSQEKMLFTKIFAVVASIMAVIGFALVLWLR